MTLTVMGFPACLCQVEWFRAFFAELKDRGLIEVESDLGLVQVIGDAADSKGYHKGGCADWRNTSVEIAAVARMMGAPATWVRDGSRDTFDDNEHTHSGLRGCVHASAGLISQIKEVDAGGDGLIGGVPDDPRLRDFLNKRTWRQGIEWHRQQELRRMRIAKIEAARARRDRYRARAARAQKFINRLKSLI